MDHTLVVLKQANDCCNSFEFDLLLDLVCVRVRLVYDRWLGSAVLQNLVNQCKGSPTSIGQLSVETLFQFNFL